MSALTAQEALAINGMVSLWSTVSALNVNLNELIAFAKGSSISIGKSESARSMVDRVGVAVNKICPVFCSTNSQTGEVYDSGRSQLTEAARRNHTKQLADCRLTGMTGIFGLKFMYSPNTTVINRLLALTPG